MFIKSENCTTLPGKAVRVIKMIKEQFKNPEKSFIGCVGLVQLLKDEFPLLIDCFIPQYSDFTCRKICIEGHETVFTVHRYKNNLEECRNRVFNVSDIFLRLSDSRIFNFEYNKNHESVSLAAYQDGVETPSFYQILKIIYIETLTGFKPDKKLFCLLSDESFCDVPDQFPPECGVLLTAGFELAGFLQNMQKYPMLRILFPEFENCSEQKKSVLYPLPVLLAIIFHHHGRESALKRMRILSLPGKITERTLYLLDNYQQLNEFVISPEYMHRLMCSHPYFSMLCDYATHLSDTGFEVCLKSALDRHQSAMKNVIRLKPLQLLRAGVKPGKDLLKFSQIIETESYYGRISSYKEAFQFIRQSLSGT